MNKDEIQKILDRLCHELGISEEQRKTTRLGDLIATEDINHSTEEDDDE